MRERGLNVYENRVDFVRRLLRRAVFSGEKGLLQSDLTSACMYASNMTRAYETALKWSLGVSLTRSHCDCIDQRSHEIELLKPRLERKIVNLRRRRASQTIRCAVKRRNDVRPAVQLFAEHCAKVRNTAQKMRKMNADLLLCRGA
jgi:hypothetical protein